MNPTEAEITKLREDIADLRVNVAIMHEKQDSLMASKVERKAVVDKLAEEVDILKSARQQALGERTIMISLAIFIGGILQALASNLFSKH